MTIKEYTHQLCWSINYTGLIVSEEIEHSVRTSLIRCIMVKNKNFLIEFITKILNIYNKLFNWLIYTVEVLIYNPFSAIETIPS